MLVMLCPQMMNGNKKKKEKKKKKERFGPEINGEATMSK